MEALAATGGLPRDALHSQLAAAVQVVLHMRRLPSGARVLDTVAVLGRDDRTVTVLPVWTRAEGWTAAQAALGALLQEREVIPPW
jgi:pilus assembly protein CpaF